LAGQRNQGDHELLDRARKLESKVDDRSRWEPESAAMSQRFRGNSLRSLGNFHG